MEPKSRFFISFRLKPERSFAGLRFQISTTHGYEMFFHDDMVWIGFDATPSEWDHKLKSGRETFRTLAAILTVQVQYPFEIEAIQWIEYKPRHEGREASYVLGKIGPDLVVQKEPPTITSERMLRSAIYTHLCMQNQY